MEMTVNQAFEIVSAPFVIESAYAQAEATILKQCATRNQRALYANLPMQVKQGFLKAIVNHRLVESAR